MTGIEDILSAFTAITLNEMDRVKLMDRKDTKYVFREDTLPLVLHDLMTEYKVLAVNNARAPRYQTDYYDTPDFFHFQQHHSKHLNRYKVRTRRYLESNDAFFEIKFRNNHGRTVKQRILLQEGEEAINERMRIFLRRKTPVNDLSLEHKLRVRYRRITLVHHTLPERVTIDYDLHYSNEGGEHGYEKLIIAEVKQERKAVSPFIRLMRTRRIREFRISKYCLGIMTLYGHVRHNLLKPKLRYLNRIIHASDGHS